MYSSQEEKIQVSRIPSNDLFFVSILIHSPFQVSFDDLILRTVAISETQKQGNSHDISNNSPPRNSIPINRTKKSLTHRLK